MFRWVLCSLGFHDWKAANDNRFIGGDMIDKCSVCSCKRTSRFFMGQRIVFSTEKETK